MWFNNFPTVIHERFESLGTHRRFNPWFRTVSRAERGRGWRASREELIRMRVWVVGGEYLFKFFR
jgi:hypothetical protein